MKQFSSSCISQIATVSIVATIIIIAAGGAYLTSTMIGTTSHSASSSSSLTPSYSYTNTSSFTIVYTSPCTPFSTTVYGNNTVVFCSVTSSASYTTLNSFSTYTNPSSLSELRLEAVLNSSVMVANGQLSLVVNETNISTGILNISAKPGWISNYCDGLNLPGALVFPIDVALFSGHDTENNISQANSIYFHPQMMCPDYVISGTNAPSYSFSPESDIANVTNWISGDGPTNFNCSLPQGQYCISYSLQLPQCCYYFHQEYYPANSSSLVAGRYTIKVFDMWGRTILLHFTVLTPSVIASSSSET